MTTAGRTPGVNYAKKVREYFEANRNRDVALEELRAITGEGGELGDVAKTRGVVNYLRTQRNMKITVVKRGEVWRYNKNARRRVGPRNDVPVDTQVDAYIASNQPPEFAESTSVRVASDAEAAQRMRNLADKLADPITEGKWRGREVLGVPQTEPVVTLRVIGTLRETGEVLVQGDTTQGFESGVWALRKLG